MTQEAYKIRLIQQADDPAMESIILTVMGEHGAIGEGFSSVDIEVEQMSKHYQDAQSRFYVVTFQGKIFGGAGFAPLLNGPADVCELRKMYFLNEARGLGLGHKMLGHCLNEAAKAGFKRCYLETLQHMEKARRLYQQAGFKPMEQPLGNTGHCQCNSWMIKDL